MECLPAAELAARGRVPGRGCVGLGVDGDRAVGRSTFDGGCISGVGNRLVRGVHFHCVSLETVSLSAMWGAVLLEWMGVQFVCEEVYELRVAEVGGGTFPRGKTMKTDDPAKPSAWDELRRRRRRFLIGWLGLFVLVPCLPFVTNGSLSLPAKCVAGILSGAWILMFVVAGYRLNYFSCPRCAKPFFGNRRMTNTLVSRCQHCGLPKWEEVEGKDGG